MTKPYDLALSMATYFNPYGHAPVGYRKELYNAAIESLQGLNRLGLKIVLVLRDDGSTEPPGRPNLPFDVDFLIRPQHLGFSENLHLTTVEAVAMAEWVLWLDNDFLIMPDALYRLFRLVHRFPTSPAYGGFNSKYCETLEQHDEWVAKTRLTELGTLFRTARLEGYDGPMANLQGGLWMTLCKTPEGVSTPNFWPCLRPSVVQHTGLLGYNTGFDDYDPEWEGSFEFLKTKEKYASRQVEL